MFPAIASPVLLTFVFTAFRVSHINRDYRGGHGPEDLLYTRSVYHTLINSPWYGNGSISLFVHLFGTFKNDDARFMLKLMCDGRA